MKRKNLEQHDVMLLKNEAIVVPVATVEGREGRTIRLSVSQWKALEHEAKKANLSLSDYLYRMVAKYWREA